MYKESYFTEFMAVKSSFAMTSYRELWTHWFTCCLPLEGTNRNFRQRPRTRLRIDRTMIGVPTNFRHMAHVNSGDLDMSSDELNKIELQMTTKVGFDSTYNGVKVILSST